MSDNTSVPQPFSIDDLDVLIEAVEAWENKDLAGDMMSEILMSALGDRRDPADAAKIRAERGERRREQEQGKRQRKERSILLRAKLIQMLDAQRANGFTSSSLAASRPPAETTERGL